jgi:hypothetical protein
MKVYEFTPCQSCPSPMACRDVGYCNKSAVAPAPQPEKK